MWEERCCLAGGELGWALTSIQYPSVQEAASASLQKKQSTQTGATGVGLGGRLRTMWGGVRAGEDLHAQGSLARPLSSQYGAAASFSRIEDTSTDPGTSTYQTPLPHLPPVEDVTVASRQSSAASTPLFRR